MSDILNKATVLVLNRHWQAIHVRTPAEAFCQMAANAATGLEIEGQDHIVPRSRGGPSSWENRVWAGRDPGSPSGTARRANRQCTIANRRTTAPGLVIDRWPLAIRRRRGGAGGICTLTLPE